MKWIKVNGKYIEPENIEDIRNAYKNNEPIPKPIYKRKINLYEEFTKLYAKECLRVLKPGGHLLSFGSTRTYHRMTCAVEDAGFTIRDMIEWVYQQGFPKSQDIAKAYDKICGESGRKEKFVKWMGTTNLSANEINKITGTFMGSHYLTAKEQPAIPTAEMWAKLRPHIQIEIPKWVDELVERIEKEREVVGQKTKGSSPLPGNHDGVWNDGQRDGKFNITKGNSQWEGFGTNLKPSHEPIVLARKPLSEKSIVENCIKHGTGALDIDSCRIPINKDIERRYDLENSGSEPMKKTENYNPNVSFGQKDFNERTKPGSHFDKGRFPPNLLVTGDALNDGEMTKSGFMEAETPRIAPTTNTYGEWNPDRVRNNTHGDSGSKSRYFDIDCWAEKHGIIQCPKASKKERDKNLTGYVLKSNVEESIVEEIKKMLAFE